MSLPIPLLRLVAMLVLAASFFAVQATAHAQARWKTTQKIILEDDFSDAELVQWTHSIEDQKPHPVNSERIDVVPAGGAFTGNAVRFELPGEAGTWRSELALFPAEQGFKERWYSQSVAVERVATDPSGFIVMQWHALMGDDRVTRNFPNMSISVKNDRWVIRRAWGSPANIQREQFEVPTEAVVPRQWADWVVRARWSEGADGRIEAWLNGRLVYGVNARTCTC